MSTLHVEELGQGPRVLLVHGSGSSGSAAWSAQLPLAERFRPGADNLAASGVLAFGMMFRVLAVMVVLVAVASSNAHVALAAAAVYALAYTAELGLSVAGYFGQEPTL